MKETEKNPHTHGGHPQEESHMSQGSVEEDSSWQCAMTQTSHPR